MATVQPFMTFVALFSGSLLVTWCWSMLRNRQMAKAHHRVLQPLRRITRTARSNGHRADARRGRRWRGLRRLAG